MPGRGPRVRALSWGVIRSGACGAPRGCACARAKPTSPALRRAYSACSRHLISSSKHSDTLFLPIFRKFASDQSLRTEAISSWRRRTIHKSRPTQSRRSICPFRMGCEVVRGLGRWRLWMDTKDFDPHDIDRSPILRERVRACATFRQGSKKKATVAGAQTAHLFQENRQPSEPYVAVPRVVSETRLFYTAAHLSEDVIAGDKVYTALDPDGFLFAIISSSMFTSWQKLVGGRLKSDLNFPNKIVWNTLPLPAVSDKQRAAIIAAGRAPWRPARSSRASASPTCTTRWRWPQAC